MVMPKTGPLFQVNDPPTVFTPFSFTLDVSWGHYPYFAAVPGHPDLFASDILYDPTDYVKKIDGSPFLKGTVYNRGTYDFPQATYKATDAETLAAITITFDTVSTFGDQQIQTYYMDQHGAFYRTFVFQHAGSLYPAGTATNYEEQTFFPQDRPASGIIGDNTAYLSNSVYGPVAVNVGVTAPGPYYSNCTLDTIIAYPRPDASGNMTSGWIYFPPRPMDYDIWAPAGKYLVGHIGFPAGSLWYGENSQQSSFTLTALYVYRAAAPPYITESDTEIRMPTVIAGERDIAGQPGGGTASQPSITPALLGHPSRHYNRAATLMNGTQALGVRYWRSNKAIPLLSGPAPLGRVWDTGSGYPGQAVGISNVVGDNSPSLAEDARGLLYCLFNRAPSTATGGGAMLSVSYSDGDSWSTPVMAISGGTHPAMASAEGRMLCAAVTTTGTAPSQTRHITAVYRGPGDLNFGPPYTFNIRALGGALTPFTVADDSFGLVFTDEGPGRMALHVAIAGESATSDWWSADNGETWTRVILQ